jgi:molybdate transport system substrate-binding protein
MLRRTLGIGIAVAAILQGAEVRIFVSNGVKAVVEELRPQCERAAGHTLAIQFGTTSTLKQKIEAGEKFDAVLLTSEAVDALAKEGKVDAGTVKDLGRAGVGVGIRAGAAKPDIRTSEALKKTLLNAKSITYAQDGASRVFIEKMFDHLGIASQMKPKTMLVPGSGAANANVAGGQEELVLTLVSEILPAPGVELAGPFPSELQNYVSFRAGISANAENRDAAQAFINVLTGSKAAATWKAKGLER